MFTGHVGLALGAKGLFPFMPLWALVFAAELPDWIDALTCLGATGITASGMLSHSIPAIAIQGAAFGTLVYVVTGGGREVSQRTSGNLAWIIAVVTLLILSHSMADYLTGVKPTWPGGPRIGLRLYQKPAIDFLLEGLVIVGGWMLYRRSLDAKRKMRLEVWLMLAALLAMQLAADVALALFAGVSKC